MYRVLIIEDDEAILMPLEDDLRLDGYEITSVQDGRKGLAAAVSGTWDLVVLDLMLPSLDGLEICRRLRAGGDTTPVLILTARVQEVDRILGLELGADDYVTKPFSRKELLARVRALIRRSSWRSEPEEVFRWNGIEVDFRTREVLRHGRTLTLTPREFDLLHFLIAHRDEAVHRGSILREVWEDADDVFPRTIDTHIAHLRKKLERDPARPAHIVNVRGVGYRFKE
jgi:DNA-binding response OmpR family regulator